MSRVAGWVAALVVGIGLALSVNGTTASAINGAPQLTFPWGNDLSPDGANPNGQFTGGPHNYAGVDTGHSVPWNSLDLAPRDGRVYAARGGFAYLECYNAQLGGYERIQIVHGDGYVTTYLHLDPGSINVANGAYVTRHTWLANYRTTAQPQLCGTGYGHVHFSLWYVPSGGTANVTDDSQAVDWGGQNGSSIPTAFPGQPQIGAWTVDDGGSPGQLYAGCMTPVSGPGTTKCPAANPCSPCTYIYNDSINAQIPVARRPSGTNEDLVTRGTTLHGYHAQTDPYGTPYGWEDFAGIFKGSPTATWDANTTQLDIFGIGTDDRVWHRVWTPNPAPAGSWSAWSVIGTSPGRGFSGLSLTETVTVDRPPPAGGTQGFDVLIRGPAGDVEDGVLDGTGTLLGWVSVGSPFGAGVKGTPSGRWNLQGTRQDIFAVGNDDHLYVTTWTGTRWIDWRALPGPAVASAGTSTTGAVASVNEMVMAVRAPDNTIDLFYRGQSNDAVHIWVDSNANFVGSESLGGVVKGAPDGMWNATKTRLDIFVIGNDDRAYQNTGTPGASPVWSGWRLLPGGGSAG